MTKPSLSWTDRRHVSALVERCRVVVTAVPRPGAKLVAAPVTVQAPSQASPPPARQRPRVPPFVASAPSIEERVDAFLSWTVDNLAARAAFIADEGGLSLGNRGDVDDLAAVSTSVFHLLDEYRRELPTFEVGRVMLDMVRPNGVLHMVVVRTSLGRFGAGVFCDDALERSALSALEAGLTATLTE